MNSRDDAAAVARLASRPEQFRTPPDRRGALKRCWADLPLAQTGLVVTAIPVLPLLLTSVPYLATTARHEDAQAALACPPQVVELRTNAVDPGRPCGQATINDAAAHSSDHDAHG